MIFKKQNMMELPRKKNRKKIEVCRNLTFDALCIKEVIQKCQRPHAQFPFGRDVCDRCLRQTFRTAYETQGKSYDRMDFFQTQY